jgi:hypothetical protein
MANNKNNGKKVQGGKATTRPANLRKPKATNGMTKAVKLPAAHMGRPQTTEMKSHIVGLDMNNLKWIVASMIQGAIPHITQANAVNYQSADADVFVEAFSGIVRDLVNVMGGRISAFADTAVPLFYRWIVKAVSPKSLHAHKYSFLVAGISGPFESPLTDGPDPQPIWSLRASPNYNAATGLQELTYGPPSGNIEREIEAAKVIWTAYSTVRGFPMWKSGMNAEVPTENNVDVFMPVTNKTNKFDIANNSLEYAAEFEVRWPWLTGLQLALNDTTRSNLKPGHLFGTPQAYMGMVIVNRFGPKTNMRAHPRMQTLNIMEYYAVMEATERAISEKPEFQAGGAPDHPLKELNTNVLVHQLMQAAATQFLNESAMTIGTRFNSQAKVLPWGRQFNPPDTAQLATSSLPEYVIESLRACKMSKVTEYGTDHYIVNVPCTNVVPFSYGGDDWESSGVSAEFNFQTFREEIPLSPIYLVYSTLNSVLPAYNDLVEKNKREFNNATAYARFLNPGSLENRGAGGSELTDAPRITVFIQGVEDEPLGNPIGRGATKLVPTRGTGKETQVDHLLRRQMDVLKSRASRRAYSGPCDKTTRKNLQALHTNPGTLFSVDIPFSIGMSTRLAGGIKKAAQTTLALVRPKVEVSSCFGNTVEEFISIAATEFGLNDTNQNPENDTYLQDIVNGTKQYVMAAGQTIAPNEGYQVFTKRSNRGEGGVFTLAGSLAGQGMRDSKKKNVRKHAGTVEVAGMFLDAIAETGLAVGGLMI